MSFPHPFRGRPGEETGRSVGDYHLSATDLGRIVARGSAMLGVELGSAKRHMVYSRLSRRLRELDLPSFTAYLDFLDTPAGVVEHQNFANALTTNLTSFFREAHHFEHLEREIQRHPSEDPTRRFRVWSAGCSTGEEPYSIAFVLHSQAGMLAGRERRILATDIDTDVLERAMQGVYTPDRTRTIPMRFKGVPYLNRRVDGISIGDPIRDLVVFRTLNLIEPLPFRAPFDVIFCRNVLIYFAIDMRATIIDRMAGLLRPGGVLYLGHSESLPTPHPLLEAEGQTIYRRRWQ